MKQPASLHELYLHELRDIYSAEEQILKALPKVKKAASDPKLIEAVETHIAQTKVQVQRLQQIFEGYGEKPKGEMCEGMEGLLKEGDQAIEEFEAGPIRDAALIAACQKVEHYEISAYGTVCAFAQLMGHEEDASLLEETLNEESDTDEILTEVAMGVNQEALELDPEMAGASSGEGKGSSKAKDSSSSENGSSDSSSSGGGEGGKISKSEAGRKGAEAQPKEAKAAGGRASKGGSS